MFRPMRRINQLLPEEVCKDILTKAQTGVLSVQGDDGYPYGVPVNFAYADGKIYFHGAMEGHKLDAIRKDEKVSFTVIDAEEVVPERRSTNFRSVICFGRAREVTEREKKIESLKMVGYKYCPGYEAEVDKETMEKLDRTLCVEIEVEHMTGKEARVLMEQRKAAGK